MHRALPALLAAALVAIHPATAHAWGRAGHEIVCAIAWDELKPAALAQVKTILGVSTREEFAPLCNWADDYRTAHGETTGWHYVDVPPGATSIDIQRDCLGPDSCVIMEIGINALKLQDGTGSAEERAQALKFLIHFVGDIHQPLHASYARDHGGTDIKGHFLGKPMHLHRVWDSGIIEADGRSWEQMTADLEKEITPEDRRKWSASKPLDWANESLTISLAPETGYATYGETFDLSDDYEKRNLPVVLQRLKQAGVRLASTLNEVLM